MMQLGNGVLMFYRKGSTVLPALSPGQYPLTPVRDMPVLLEPGPGVVIKSAVYYPLENRAEIMLEAFTAKEIEICIDRMPAGSYGIELVQPDGKKTIRNVNVNENDSGMLKTTVQLPQDVMRQVNIFRRIASPASSTYTYMEKEG